MRTLLGTLTALVLLLTGCGDEGPDRASDPAAPSSSSGSGTPSGPASPSSYPDGNVPFDLVAVVAGSAARGSKPSPDPTVLGDQQAVLDFAAQFQGTLRPDLVDQAEKAELDADQTLVAAVVDVGCEPPTDIHVRMVLGALKVTATPVLSRRECFVPVTSVALVAVPSAAAATVGGQPR